jgi:hypothetical protein
VRRRCQSLDRWLPSGWGLKFWSVEMFTSWIFDELKYYRRNSCKKLLRCLLVAMSSNFSVIARVTGWFM